MSHHKVFRTAKPHRGVWIPHLLKAGDGHSYIIQAYMCCHEWSQDKNIFPPIWGGVRTDLELK